MKSPSSSHSSGVALVVVLCFLVIIAVVIVMFLTSVSMERRAASSTQTLVSNRQLSDMAVSLVQAQIRQATTRGATIAWASQPGMIRTFSSSGGLDTAYKLYSATDFSVTNNLSANLAAELASAKANWTNSACYADLNAPVTQVEGTQTNIIFPIADPRAFGRVDGFSFTSDFGATTNTVSPKLPMPVQWIYMLQDGTLVAPASVSINSISLPGASSTNPAVGRIAYWTDDDSAKININTASEGTYWDTPRLSSLRVTADFTDPDLQYSIYQPAQREYQRYPGHPAMTSLSPVLLSYMPSDVTLGQFKEKLYNLLPKYNSGGSVGGTVTPTTYIAAKDQPLFATVDELFFSPTNRAVGILDGSPVGVQNALAQTRFFLSANSRSPEVNLFNLPRINLWPISSSTGATSRTGFDSLVTFCSTIGNQIFSFTRTAPNSLNGDLSGRNKELFNYLLTLMENPVPGFSQSTSQTFATKFGSDYKQILVEIYDYIRMVNLQDKSTSAIIPFTPKFKTITSNGASIVTTTPGAGQLVPFQHPSLTDPSTGNHLQGFGRFPMISEAVIHFLAEDNGQNTVSKQDVRAALYFEMSVLAHGFCSYSPDLRISVSGLDSMGIKTSGQATYKPLGFPPSPARNYYNQTGTGTESQHRDVGGSMGIIPQLFYYDPSTGSTKIKKVKPDTTATDDPTVYPFVSDVVQLGVSTTVVNGSPVVSGIFDFSGGNLTATLEAKDQTGQWQTVQTYTFTFPECKDTWPCPTQYATTHQTTPTTPKTLSQRIAAMPSNQFWGPALLFGVSGAPSGGGAGTDVVKSLEPVSDDLRLIACLPNVPASSFQQHKNYSSANTAAHSVTGGPALIRYSSISYGLIVQGQTTDSTRAGNPNISSRTTTGVQNQFGKPGDFDTGVADNPDGPWINKADEGSAVSPSAISSTYIPYYGGTETDVTGESLFSPNRQIPSAGVVGSLPTGVLAGKPWQTLLFCPNPAAVTSESQIFNASIHPGFGLPRDHLLMDLFWMPVVEPYAISDSFSTAGKINLNTQIIPFGVSGTPYIKRETGMAAVLKSVKLGAIPKSDGSIYKVTAPKDYRYSLDTDATLAEMRKRFLANLIYISPTEVCDVLLIPKSGGANPVTASGLTGANVISNFWMQNQLTGDNLREKPYVEIYPRITTKSNVYTVHYTVQTLKKVPGSTTSGWDETKDKVIGELRGSATLERFIDPNDPAFNLAKNNFTQAVAGSPSLSNIPTLDKFYKFRVIATREFRP